LILQGKGGVGKSFIAALLAQYLQEKGVAVRCFDADPVNSTLASFPAYRRRNWI
jgi:CO dehydrogenase nickel-insertion accessory protein CooC1